MIEGLTLAPATTQASREVEKLLPEMCMGGADPDGARSGRQVVVTSTLPGCIFDEGTAARKQSEEYTGTTVVLATVLFLVALSPRFRSRRVRFVLLLLTGASRSMRS
jgi:hypothetical protein